ncbi:MAG: guanylate kinase [Lentisphaerae bacterium]|nr:guanylate kinase [Lentisphaerota bacterium]
MKPMLIVISAPSGGGKSTLCDRLLQDYPETVYSVSCTTRQPRGEEEDGVDYHFLDDEAFERLVRQRAFLEHARVHDHSYGTLEAPVREAMAQGLSVIMDIDVNGAGQIRDAIAALPQDDPLHAGYLDIFILPPSVEELRRRLESRGEDSAATIERRIRNAQDELAQAGDFHYRVVNQDLDLAYRELCAILEHAGCVAGPNNPPGRQAKPRKEAG